MSWQTPLYLRICARRLQAGLPKAWLVEAVHNVGPSRVKRLRPDPRDNSEMVCVCVCQ